MTNIFAIFLARMFTFGRKASYLNIILINYKKMVKKSLLVLAATISTVGSVYAQNKTCATDEMMNKARAEHPEIIQFEAQMEQQIKEGLKHIDLSRYAAKGTADPDSAINGSQPGVVETIPPESPADRNKYVYHIPIVIHVIHDYGAEYVDDNDIYEAVKEWNKTYMQENADTADVISPYRYHDPLHPGYIGNPRIVLHLANRDPNGNPTKGILHHRSYLAYNGGDQAKYDDWPNNAYINIWSVRSMPGHSSAAAYAYYPSAVQAPSMAPYDGVISLYDYMIAGKTINHEIGHCLNLKHTWGDTNNPEVGCGDDDVDDTPPTKGHNPQNCTPTALYDTTCALGYAKNYIIHDTETVVIDYPDTVNSQNIMDYTYCDKMFTKGQVLRMHQTLNLDVANRDHLWSTQNLIATGLLLDATKDPRTDIIPMQDLAPIPDFSVEKGKVTGVPPSERTYFTCANNSAMQFSFVNRSWNDTITSVKMTFSNGASQPSVTLSGAGLSSTVNNTFSEPGWVTVGMEVLGNGANAATPVSSSTQAVYVADGDHPTVVDPQVAQYFMDFRADQTANWPIFNYYNNEFKWELDDAHGFLDHSCIRYSGFDNRPFPANAVGTPGGDYDDFFSPAFDLTAMSSGDCNLNFMSTGTFRTGNPADMKDSLIISYSTDCGRNWQLLKGITKHDLGNNGTLTIAYAPLTYDEWALHSIDLPAAARTNKTFFRFRYKPGVDGNQTGTGNNFYLDRINISNFPLGVNTLVSGAHKVAVAPNPTTGSSYVIINGGGNETATVRVTDVTGRVVYTTSKQLASGLDRVEIPASVLEVKGMYMVHVNTGAETYTEKLVAY